MFDWLNPWWRRTGLIPVPLEPSTHGGAPEVPCTPHVVVGSSDGRDVCLRGHVHPVRSVGPGHIEMAFVDERQTDLAARRPHVASGSCPAGMVLRPHRRSLPPNDAPAVGPAGTYRRHGSSCPVDRRGGLGFRGGSVGLGDHPLHPQRANVERTRHELAQPRLGLR